MITCICLLFTVILSIGDLLQAQPPDIDWINQYGGDQQSDQAYCVLALPDGRMIIGGRGDFGEPSSTTSGVLVQIDSDGNRQWARDYAEFGISSIRSILLASNGGFVATGWDPAGLLAIAKFDISGEVEWTSQPSILGTGWGESLIDVPGRGYAAVTHGSGSTGMALFLVGYLGDTLLSRTYGGSFNHGYDIELTANGGFIMCGDVLDVPVTSGFILLADSNGTPLDANRIGGDENVDARFTSMCEDGQGGYVVVGWRTNSNDTDNPYLVRLDALADTIWTTTDTNEVNAGLWDVCRLSDGTFGAVGTKSLSSTSDILLLNFDSSGHVIWSQTYGDDSIEHGLALTELECGSVGIAGWRLSSGVQWDIRAMETDCFLHAQAPHPISRFALDLKPNYPNPFNGSTYFQLSVSSQTFVAIRVFGITGRHIQTVFSGWLSAGTSTHKLQAESLPSGTYVLSAYAQSKSTCRTITLVR